MRWCASPSNWKAQTLIREDVDPKVKEAEPAKTAISPRQELSQAIGTLKKFGLVGACDLAYRAGNYDVVLSKEMAGGVLAQVEGLSKQPGQKIQLPDFQVTGDILGFALRAQVQKSDIKSAQLTLDLLQRLTGPGGVDNDPTAVLRSLLGELQQQLKELRQKGDQERLKQTRGNFSAFIDALARQSGKKAMARNDIIFLATCYNSLDEYAKAAELYAQVQPPVLDPAKVNDEKAKEEFEKDRQAYWLIQVLYGSALRQSKKVKEAEKVFARILATPDAAGKLLAEKEQIILLEDKGLYGAAIKRWGEFMGNDKLKRQLSQSEDAKKVYFDAYYHYSLCWFKYSQGAKLKGTDREKKFLTRAANYIVQLENSRNQDGWRLAGPAFQELLRQEPALHRAYQELKRTSK